MCRHTRAQTICGRSHRDYSKYLRERKRFRLYICPRTEKDIREAIEAHNDIPPIDTLLNVCGLVLGSKGMDKILRDKLLDRARFFKKIMDRDAATVAGLQTMSLDEKGTVTTPRCDRAVHGSQHSGPLEFSTPSRKRVDQCSTPVTPSMMTPVRSRGLARSSVEPIPCLLDVQRPSNALNEVIMQPTPDSTPRRDRHFYNALNNVPPASPFFKYENALLASPMQDTKPSYSDSGLAQCRNIVYTQGGSPPVSVHKPPALMPPSPVQANMLDQDDDVGNVTSPLASPALGLGLDLPSLAKRMDIEFR